VSCRPCHVAAPVTGPAHAPLLGVCVAADGPLAAVLAELARWLPMAPCADDGRPYEGRPPDVFLATAPIGHRPWLQLAGADDPVDPDALAVLCADPAPLAAAQTRGVALPTHPGWLQDTAAVRWTPPFVRRRMRAALGPAGTGALIADRRGPRWLDDEAAAVDAGRLDAALARCAAVWTVDAEVGSRALAWGAPLLVPEAVARELGLTTHVNVRISDTTGMRAALAELAGEEDTAARLSWAGRQRYEDLCDAARCAARIADAVDRVLPLRHDGLLRATLELALLGTPPGARAPARLLRASEGLATDRPPAPRPDDGGPPVSLPPAASQPIGGSEGPAPAPASARRPGRLARLMAARTDRLRSSGRDLARRGIHRVEDRVYQRVQDRLLADSVRLDGIEQVLSRIEVELVGLRTSLPRRLGNVEGRMDAIEARLEPLKRRPDAAG